MSLVLGQRNGSLSNSYYHQLIAGVGQHFLIKLEKVLASNEKIKYLAGEIKIPTIPFT